MSNHQAMEQMLGYLYQVRYALLLLLQNEDNQAQISLEKFDDVAFISDDNPELMIQLKHHTRNHGNLTDSSTDLWRTIKVWVDAVSDNNHLLSYTKFVVITTATAPENSAASYLKSSNNSQNRNAALAFRILKEVAETSDNKGHKPYYDAFSNLGDEVAAKLIDNIYVFDRSSNIIDVKEDIKKQIRYGCLPRYEQRMGERLEGWWYSKCIECLVSDVPVYINQNQIRAVIASFRDEYTEDNLPVDVPLLDYVNIDDLPEKDRVFVEQLRLICLGNQRVSFAIRDYYRAFKQRANWIRDELLYINELTKYEERLIDEWQRMFFTMKEELEDYGDELDEKTKQRYGKEFFGRIQEKDIRIRERCGEPFIMRGSYHSLANRMSVGWHVDFETRLRQLLIR